MKTFVRYRVTETEICIFSKFSKKAVKAPLFYRFLPKVIRYQFITRCNKIWNFISCIFLRVKLIVKFFHAQNFPKIVKSRSGTLKSYKSIKKWNLKIFTKTIKNFLIFKQKKVIKNEKKWESCNFLKKENK